MSWLDHSSDGALLTVIANILLLILGFSGAVTAFCGDTLRKDATGLFPRITKVGWWSLAFLAAALGVGIWKEVLQHRSEVQQELAAREAVAARERLEKDLAVANTQLQTTNANLEATTSRLNATATDLATAQAKLDALQPALVGAMYTLTERIPRESDFAFVNLDGLEERVPISSETQLPLRLFGGDEVEYNTLCRGSFSRESPAPVMELVLRAGARDYPLVLEHGTFRVAGPIGEALSTRILNPRQTHCSVKLIIKSTDRRRIREQYAPVLAALQDASGREAGGRDTPDEFFKAVLAFTTPGAAKVAPVSKVFRTRLADANEFFDIESPRIRKLLTFSVQYDASADTPSVSPAHLQGLFFPFMERQGYRFRRIADRSLRSWENKVYRFEHRQTRDVVYIHFESEQNPSRGQAYAKIHVGKP